MPFVCYLVWFGNQDHINEESHYFEIIMTSFEIKVLNEPDFFLLCCHSDKQYFFCSRCTKRKLTSFLFAYTLAIGNIMKRVKLLNEIFIISGNS